MPHRTTSRRAFTLVELLVAIAVIGVLIGITLPALGAARIEARKAQSIANARSIAGVFHMYADTKGHYPFQRVGELPSNNDGSAPPQVALPPGVLAVRWWPNNIVVAQASHWAHERLWPGMVSSLAPWPDHYPTWVSPGRSAELPDLETIQVGGGSFQTGAINAVSYYYSHSFVARPTLWQDGAESALSENILGPVRPAHVAFPANKAMLYDAELAYLRKSPRIVNGHWDAPSAIAFADGHAAMHNPTHATPGRANPLNGGDTRTLHNTPGGVLGTDY